MSTEIKPLTVEGLEKEIDNNRKEESYTDFNTGDATHSYYVYKKPTTCDTVYNCLLSLIDNEHDVNKKNNLIYQANEAIANKKKPKEWDEDFYNKFMEIYQEKRQAEEAEATRQAEEAEATRQAEEAEAKRQVEEAKQKKSNTMFSRINFFSKPTGGKSRKQQRKRKTHKRITHKRRTNKHANTKK